MNAEQSRTPKSPEYRQGALDAIESLLATANGQLTIADVKAFRVGQLKAQEEIAAIEKPLSDCHQAPVTVGQGTNYDIDPESLGRGDTCFYVCTKCNEACDQYVKPTEESKDFKVGATDSNIAHLKLHIRDSYRAQSALTQAFGGVE